MNAFKKFLLIFFLGILFVLVVMLCNGTFVEHKMPNSLGDDRVDIVGLTKDVCDAFFIPAVLFSFFGLIVIFKKYLQKDGMFTFLTKFFRSIFKSAQKDIIYRKNKTMASYRAAVKEEDQSIWQVFVVGLILLAGTGVSYWMFLQATL